MDQEPFPFHSPASPLQVSVILKEIFKKLKFPDLANCRQVSKLWDCEASKQLWEVCRIRPVSWKWLNKGDLQVALSDDQEILYLRYGIIPTADENELKEAILRGPEEIIKLKNSSKILDVFRSRIPSSKDSLISVKIGSPALGGKYEHFYSTHYHDAGRIIHGFLTDPILCNLLASIHLGLFPDVDVVLRLLSEVPNLREFNVIFDVKAFIKSQSVVSKWHKTSPVQKLRLALEVIEIEELGNWQQEKLGACVGVILGGCVNLKSLKLKDMKYAPGKLFRVIDANFLKASLKNPELVEELSLRSMVINEVSTPPEKLRLVNLFSKIKHLNLRGWGPFSLENWKTILRNDFLPPCLKTLAFSVFDHHQDAGSPKKLIYDHLADVGLDRLQRLSRLRIDLSRDEGLIREESVEAWELVEESLALVRAKIFLERLPPIDLRSHKHLRCLTLVGGKNDLTDALKATPPTVTELDLNLSPSWPQMADDDFRRDGALKAISSLERFRIRRLSGLGQCTTAILKHVFAEMKNLRFVQIPGLRFTESEIEESGVNYITFCNGYDDDEMHY